MDDKDTISFPICRNLLEMSKVLTNVLDRIQLTDDAQGNKKLIQRICMANMICICLKKLRDFYGD
jgi:hypothetical protein